MHRLEEDPTLAPHKILPCSLMDFLAVRLTMSRVARAPRSRGDRSGGEPTQDAGEEASEPDRAHL